MSNSMLLSHLGDGMVCIGILGLCAVIVKLSVKSIKQWEKIKCSKPCSEDGNIVSEKCEGESILPDVEELPEFHSDHLSTLSDIQEELEKLDPFDTVKEEVSLMEDVNIVDHEVTIGDEQINEEFTEGAEETQSTEKPTIISGIVENSFSTSEDRTLEETIAIIPPSSNVSASGRANSHVEPENLRVVPNKHHNVHNPPPLKAIRPLPEGLQGNKSFIAMSQPKKNMVTKVIFSPTSQTTADGSTIMLTESGGQTIRIVGQNKPTILPNSPRTLTLAQAREMGLLPGGKMQLLQSQSKSVVRKSVMMTGNKPVTLMKSPTKILPLPTSGQLHAIAPSPSINSLTQSPQKIFIRQTGPAVRPGGFSGTLLTSGPAGAAGQLLQIPATVNQDAINQIHQIQLPGKQVQYVRLVHTPVSTTGATVTATSAVPVEMIKSDPIFITTTSEPTLVTANPRPQASSPPVSSPMPMPNLKVMPITPATPTHQSSNSFERILVSPGLSQLKGKTDAKTATSNIVMVPAEYVKQFKQNPVPTTQSTTTLTGSVLSSAKAATPAGSPVVSKAKEALVAKEPALTPAPTPPAIKDRKDPPNGLRPRKPCNCTKSQCLKLYCDCFANGEFCFQCNCNCCYNNLDHEEDRQRAIRSCLERNPNAFRPKIGKGYVGDERRHNKGCHCKRSGCLKNYCECYEAKIPCSNNCKCIGCKNVEDGKDKGHERNRLVPIAVRPKPTIETVDKSITYLSSQNMRQPYARITQHVVEAACECLLAQVQEGSTPQQVERRIIEEFSRCLVTVIGFSRTAVNNLT